jgi:hypothetical protein
VALSDASKVRIYIGDTDPADQILDDATIDFALEEESSVRAAAALAAEWIAAIFSKKADMSTGDMSISYSQKATQFLAIATRLRSRSAESALPYAGGISQTSKAAREADTDRVLPAFTVDMLDRQGVSSSASEAEDA